jgi:hypothetical protein
VWHRLHRFVSDTCDSPELDLRRTVDHSAPRGEARAVMLRVLSRGRPQPVIRPNFLRSWHPRPGCAQHDRSLRGPGSLSARRTRRPEGWHVRRRGLAMIGRGPGPPYAAARHSYRW